VNESILGGKGLELIRSSLEWVAGFFGKLVSDVLSKSDISVNSSSDCCTSLSSVADVREGSLDSFETFFKLVYVS
jgi:hypothetical protein